MGVRPAGVGCSVVQSSVAPVCCCVRCRGPLSNPVELTTYSRKWLTRTVYETQGVSPCIGWLLRFIPLGLGLGSG